MKTKHALAAVVVACLSAACIGPAEAGAEQRLGKLMALPVMAEFCHLALTPEQSADIDKLGPKLQQEAGVSDDEMKGVFQELAKGLKQDDCAGIAAHWPESVSALIEQARAD